MRGIVGHLCSLELNQELVELSMSLAPAFLHFAFNFLSFFIFDNLTFSLYLQISVPCGLFCDCQPRVPISKASLTPH